MKNRKKGFKEFKESGERDSGSRLRVEKKSSVGIPEYICESCQRRYIGWSEPDICPECGGKLKLANNAKLGGF